METKNAILELRRQWGCPRMHLPKGCWSQDRPCPSGKVEIPSPVRTRYGGSRSSFHVSVDYLLGRPAALCQSCGMSLVMDSDKGTRKDGSRSEEYCAFCFQHGAFTQDLTMEELIEHNLQDLSEWNQAAGLQLTEQEARAQLMEFLPTLKRWKA